MNIVIPLYTRELDQNWNWREQMISSAIINDLYYTSFVVCTVHNYYAEYLWCGPVSISMDWCEVSWSFQSVCELSFDHSQVSVSTEPLINPSCSQAVWLTYDLSLVPRSSPAPFSWPHTSPLNCFSRWFKHHECGQENGTGDGLGTRLLWPVSHIISVRTRL